MVRLTGVTQTATEGWIGVPRKTETREKIFFAAIDLFAEKGFGACTMRHLADRVGIRAASLYKHYDSKDEILRAIFDYYRVNFKKNRLPAETVIRTGRETSVREVVPMMFYTFSLDGEYQVMMKISRIVLSMKMDSPYVREIFKEVLMDEPRAYLEEILDGLTREGALAPFDHHPIEMQFLAFTNFQLMLSLLDGQGTREDLRPWQEGIDFFTDYIMRYATDNHNP